MSIRLALIGLGRWGRQYLQVATRLPVTVVVAHTQHQDGNARWLAGRYPAVKHTTSLAEALDNRLDGVAIVTPRRSHAALTTACLRRGLHVLVEKPAVTTVEDLERTHAEARARGLVLRTGYTHCFDKSVRELGEMARQAISPQWWLSWRKPAPGTGVSELIWEYYPHVFSIAELMGGVDADRLDTARLRAAQGPSGTATVEIELPMRAGTGHVEVSSAAKVQHKGIRLHEGDEVIAEWSDRRLLDLRRNRLLEAHEEPLLCQIRSFLDAIVSPAGDASQYASDKAVTNLLIELSKKAQRAGFAESRPERGSTKDEVVE